MFNYLYDFAFNIYLLLFHPKYFFERKKEKADDLMAALPYFLFGIGIASIAYPFNSISNPMNSSFPSVASFILEYIFSICMGTNIFLIETIFVLIIIRILGEKLPYRNILATMLFLPIFLIGDLVVSVALFLFKSIFLFQSIAPICTICCIASVIAKTALLIWKSYCGIIGLSTMQQIDIKIATVGILLSFSFFYTLSIVVIST